MLLTNDTTTSAPCCAKSTPHPYCNSLYLMITPSGSKLWLMQLSHDGCSETITFGEWPLISLQEARRLRDRYLERVRYSDLAVQTSSLGAELVAGG